MLGPIPFNIVGFTGVHIRMPIEDSLTAATIKISNGPWNVVRSGHWQSESFVLEQGATYQVELASFSLGCESTPDAEFVFFNETFYIPCCEGRTGNVDMFGIYPNEVDLSDGGLLMNFLFSEPGEVVLPCVGEADIDAQGGDNPVDLSDLGLLYNFLLSPPGTVELPDCR
jgi:hypothetical protein